MIITIVVLLILASITIAIINGQTEIFDETDDARIYTELKQLQDAIESYKVERYSSKGLLKGDFSGTATNDDLALDGIIKQYSGVDINKKDIVRASENDEDKTDRTVGVIAVEELGKKLKMEIGSKLGTNISSYFPNAGNKTTDITASTGIGDLTEFVDVFAIDVDDDTLYYVNRGKIWKLYEIESSNDDNGNPDDPNHQDEPEDNYSLSVTYSSTTNKYTDAQIKSKISNGSWIDEEITATYTWGSSITSDNKELTASASSGRYNKTGTESVLVEEGTVEITARSKGTNAKQITSTIKVDIIKPKITVAKVQDGENGGNQLKVTVSDLDSNNNQTLSSGIQSSKYAFSSSATEPSEANYTAISGNEITVGYSLENENQKYLFIKATDNAGNLSTYTKKLETVAKVEISGKSDYYAISIQDAFDYAKENCGEGVQANISLLKNVEDEAALTYAGQLLVLDLKGFTIGNTSVSAATITNNSSLQVIDSTEDTAEAIGTISSENSAAIVNNNGATFILGNNDGTVSTSRPALVGDDYGLINNGTFNFYDGTITGSTHGTQGTVTATAEGYVAIPRNNEEDNTETVFLGRLADYEAKIGPKYYYTIAEAIVDATEDNEVCLVRNCVLTTKLTIEADKEVNLNMNGFDISFSGASGYLLDNYGDLNIYSIDDTDKTTVKAANMINTVGSVINNTANANLVISKVKVSSTKAGTSSQYNYAINNSGTLETNGGCEINTSNSNYMYTLYNSGSWTSNNTTITGKEFRNTATGTMVINNVTSTLTLTNEQGGVVHFNGGTLTTFTNNSDANGNEITGGTIATYNNNNGADIKITGGNITKELNHYSKNHVLNIENLTVKDVTNRYASDINMKNTTLTGTLTHLTGTTITITDNSNIGTVATSAGSTGTFIFEDSTVTKINISTAANVYVKSGTVTNGITSTYGGLVEIGENDSQVSNSTPIIKGKINMSTRTLNFYDGKIYGNPPVTAGTINIPTNCEIQSGTEENTTVWSLTNNPQPVASITKNGETTSYQRVQDAIDDCDVNEATTIQILRSHVSSESLTISEGQKITIDLGTYAITSIAPNYITNGGELTLKNGTISTNIGNIFNNQAGGKLTIESGTYTQTNKDFSSIINAGNLNIENGTITGVNYVIRNNEAGNIKVTDGTITGKKYTIYNISSGKIELESGTISAESAYDSSSYTGSYVGDCVIYNNNKDTIVEIKGGTVTNEGVGINNAAGTVKIMGGNVYTNQNWYRYVRSAIYNADIIEISSGKVAAIDEYGYAIMNHGTVTITGGEISTSKTDNNPIRNYGTVNINGGEILGYTAGIYNTGNINMTAGLVQVKKISGSILNIVRGTVNIKGGTLKFNATAPTTTDAYGIYMKESSAVLTLGEKGGEVSKTTPEIIGNKYGIYNSGNGTFNFYDGIVKGKESIYGTYTDKEEGYDVLKYEDGDYEAAVLGLDYLAKVGGNKYYTLQEAFDECPKDGIQTTVELLRNASIDDTNTVLATQNIILDLQSYTITCGTSDFIENNGTLRITDSVGTGTITNTEGTIAVNKDGANLTIDTVTLSMNNSDLTDEVIENNGYLEINSGTITTTGNNNNAIVNKGIATIKVNGGTISAVSKTIDNTSSGKIEIFNGTISASRNYVTSLTSGADAAIYNNADSIIELKGGTITALGATIANISGTINVDGANVYTTQGDGRYSRSAIINHDKLNILSGTVSATKRGNAIYNSASGITTISGGNVNTGTGADYSIYNLGTTTVTGGNLRGDTSAIYNGGEFTMTDGTIDTTTLAYNSKLFNCVGSSTTNIEGGTVKFNKTSTSNVVPAIHISTNTATVTLGKQGETVSTTNPEIVGITYGVYNYGKGTFNFYDGVIKGQESIRGNCTAIETGKEIIFADDEDINGFEDATLGNAPIAQIGETTYNSLQDAFDQCPSDGTQTTVKILRKCMTDDSAELAQGKNVVLDLQGNTILPSIANFISNKGTLQITDSVGGGIITNAVGTIVKNYANSTLTIDTVTMNFIDKDIADDLIENSGSLTINGGTLSVAGDDATVINNIGAGTLKVTDGTISGIYKTIKNESTGKVQIQGGTITAGSYSSSSFDKYKGDCAIYNNNENAIVEISGGYISNIGIGITNAKGKVIVKGGTIEEKLTDSRYRRAVIYNEDELEITAGTLNVIEESKAAVYNDGGTVTISGGNLYSPDLTTLYNDSGDVYINGGNIKGDYNAIRNYGNIVMTAGTVESENKSTYSTDSIIRCQGSSTTTIEGGTIKVNGVSADKTAYGIIIESANATLTLGKKDGNVNTLSPLIITNKYGVYNYSNGVFNFYDGVIKALDLDISGTITRVEEDHKVQISQEDDFKVATLAYESTDTQAAFVNGRYYTTVKDAIEACPEGQKAYVILVNGNTITENITITANQQIEIDLSGYQVIGASGVSITNNGSLTISDSSQNQSGTFNVTITGNAATYQN